MPLSNVQSVESRLYRFMPKQKNKDGMLKEILLKSVFFFYCMHMHTNILIKPIMKSHLGGIFHTGKALEIDTCFYPLECITKF